MAEPRASASGQPGTRVNWIFNPMPTRALILFGILAAAAVAQPADLILYNAKIVTVDSQFHIADSLAVRADRILAVGARDDRLMQVPAGRKYVRQFRPTHESRVIAVAAGDLLHG